MKKEYDFSKGERGKFYNPEAKFKIPVYLEEEVQTFFIELAGKKNVGFEEIVNKAVKANMLLFKAML